MILAYSSELVLWVRLGRRTQPAFRAFLSSDGTDRDHVRFGGVFFLSEVRNEFLPRSALFALSVSHLDLLLDAVRPDEASRKLMGNRWCRAVRARKDCHESAMCAMDEVILTQESRRGGQGPTCS